MFEFIRGELVEKRSEYVVVEAGGIGWRCEVTLNTLESLPAEGEIQIFTHLHVTENSYGLYGFGDVKERELFQLLASTSGIGPRKAISLLSEAAPGQIVQALQNDNTGLLEQASGIGKKTARRLVAELQDRAEKMADRFQAPSSSGAEVDEELVAESVKALKKLGYDGSEAQSAVQKTAAEHPEIDDPGNLVKRALQEVIS